MKNKNMIGFWKIFMKNISATIPCPHSINTFVSFQNTKTYIFTNVWNYSLTNTIFYGAE
jgi:hypothetical protein